jgi:hypothetical protein
MIELAVCRLTWRKTMTARSSRPMSRRRVSEEGVSQGDLVRRLIGERLTNRKARRSAYQIAEQLGVIGMDNDPRRDAATNHSKYVGKALRAKRTA